MPNGDQPLITRVLLVLAVLFPLGVRSAAAQPPQQPVIAPAPDHPEFLARGDYHLSASSLQTVTSTSAPGTADAVDQRFEWDTYWGGSVDVIDYVTGRIGINIDYEAVLGGEYQPFDPNQGNYTLEASASGRVGTDTEVVAIFHHVSRHLSDRAKARNPVAFNELGARILQRVVLKNNATIDLDVEGGRVMQHSYVDYTWLADLGVLARLPVSDHFGFFAQATGHLVGVNGNVPNRSTQSGGLIEAGLRIRGANGVMELFAGYEKRLDADPLDRQSQHWTLAGFRLLSR